MAVSILNVEILINFFHSFKHQICFSQLTLIFNIKEDDHTKNFKNAFVFYICIMHFQTKPVVLIDIIIAIKSLWS